MKLNPKWVLGAWVHNDDGGRFGYIGRIESDRKTVTVFSKGVPRVMNVYDLDAKGLLSKPYASDKKYVK